MRDGITDGRTDGQTDGRTDGRTDDPNTRCPRWTFQAGGIKISLRYILTYPHGSCDFSEVRVTIWWIWSPTLVSVSIISFWTLAEWSYVHKERQTDHLNTFCHLTIQLCNYILFLLHNFSKMCHTWCMKCKINCELCFDNHFCSADHTNWMWY